MQNRLYDLRFLVDRDEWRVRAKRSLVVQLWKKYHPPINRIVNTLDHE